MDSGIKTYIAVSALLLAAGCSGKKSSAKTDEQKSKSPGTVARNDGNPTPKQPQQKRPKKPAVKLTPFVPPKDVTIAEVTPQELQAFIKKQKGHVVLVDYWQTTCIPCKKVFPHTVQLGRDHAKDGLVVVTMCVQELERKRDALEYLKTKDAKTVNFFASEKLNPDNLGELFEIPEGFPLYRLYGPDGNLIQALSPGSTDTKAFEKKVDAAVMEALGL